MSTPLPADDPNRRFKRRRVDDDDRDERPVRRSRRDDEDEEDDDRPRRRPRKRTGPGISPLALVGALVGLMLLFSCCSGGIYLAFFSDLLGGNEVTITHGTRSRGMNFGFRGVPSTSDTIAIQFETTTASPSGPYTVVARCAGRTTRGPFPLPVVGKGKGSYSWSTNDFQGLTGPIEVWVEGSSGKKVSNTYTIP